MKKKIAIVTGASSGMGQEFIRQFDKALLSVEEIWVIARRRKRLETLKAEYNRIPIRVFGVDITKDDELKVIENRLQEEQPGVSLLVNAAGVGRAGRFDEITQQDALRMIDVNNRALVAITHMVLPYMLAQSNLIQIASASAFMPQTEFSVYAASKAFVFSFSRALRAELCKTQPGVVVTIVCPGPVDTEFLTLCNAGQEQKTMKKLVTVSVEPVVKKALRDAKAGKELSIYGFPMKAVYFVSKVLPHGLFLK